MESDHQPKMNPVKSFQMAHGLNDDQEPYPSLSDVHDYEPNLEFDDSEIHQPPDANTVELIQEIESSGVDSPVSDFTEENFEEQLGVEGSLLGGSGPESLMLGGSYPALGSYDALSGDAGMADTYENLNDIHRHQIVDVIGDDKLGRKIIIVYACRLPNSKDIDHSKLLKYLKFTLDQYVEQDYSLVYFHHGLTSKNKPALGWLWQAYRAFDRKYKKNLKALYLVHPTNFIRIVLQIFRPAISVKFGRKIIYINFIKELQQYMNIDRRSIPQQILNYDDQLMQRLKTPPPSSPQCETPTEPLLATKQFGVSLQFVVDNNGGDPIPPIVRQCVEYLDHPDVLETEGLFRRSARASAVTELQARADRGEQVKFSDPHEAAVLLKTFLRELTEPLLTFDLFDEIMQFSSWSKDERQRQVSILILEKLPEPNYKLLKYIVQFLSRVMDRSDLNKMTSSNLAVVFGPNLVWPETEQMSLIAIGPINMFTNFLLQHQDQIFIV